MRWRSYAIDLNLKQFYNRLASTHRFKRILLSFKFDIEVTNQSKTKARAKEKRTISSRASPESQLT